MHIHKQEKVGTTFNQHIIREISVLDSTVLGNDDTQKKKKDKVCIFTAYIRKRASPFCVIRKNCVLDSTILCKSKNPKKTKSLHLYSIHKKNGINLLCY